MDEMDTLHANKDSQVNMNFIKTERDSDSEMYLKYSHNADELLDVKEEKNPVPITFPVMKVKIEKELKEVDTVEEEENTEEDLMVEDGIGCVTDDEELCTSRNDVLCTSSCDICKKGIVQSEHIVKHNCKLSTDNLLRSQNCGKRCSRKGKILGHQSICSGGKSLKYEKCKNGISERGGEFRHQRTHTGEKCFKCDICGKIYSYKYLLVRHQRTHTGEKCFKCDICGKIYSYKYLLVRHQR
ncbi:hypothetical protein B7P43_G09293, partial [Cryptotermes secundus]